MSKLPSKPTSVSMSLPTPKLTDGPTKMPTHQRVSVAQAVARADPHLDDQPIARADARADVDAVVQADADAVVQAHVDAVVVQADALPDARADVAHMMEPFPVTPHPKSPPVPAPTPSLGLAVECAGSIPTSVVVHADIEPNPAAGSEPRAAPARRRARTFIITEASYSPGSVPLIMHGEMGLRRGIR